MRHFLFLSIASLMVVGCGSTSTAPEGSAKTPEPGKAAAPSTPAATIPAGWTTLTSPDGAFTMAVPKEWIVVKPAGDERIKEVEQKNAMLAQAWKGIATNEQVGVFAADLALATKPGAFVNNMNVVTMKNPAFSKDTDEVLKARLDALPKQFTNGQGEIVTINGRKMVKYWGDFAQGAVKTSLMGLQSGHNGTDYTFTFTTDQGKMEASKALYEQIMGTIQFK